MCNAVNINAPLHPETEHLFNDDLIGKMKRIAYLVNGTRADMRPRYRGSCPGERAIGALRRRRLVPIHGGRCRITA